VSPLDLAPSESTLEAGGFAKGVAIGVVTQNKDDEGLGRVKVNFPWYGKGPESYWARIAVPMAGDKQGSYFLPEIGQEVLIGFEREDIRFPVVLGALWNGKEAPPTTNSDGKNDVRLIRSRAGHELMFNDGDQPKVELKLKDGKHLVFDQDGVVLEDGKGNIFKIESSSGAISIKAVGELKIEAASISMQAKGSMELKSGGALTVRGSVVQIN
jgi:uncharacterized protein involved in type VI secretion and phage assembly